MTTQYNNTNFDAPDYEYDLDGDEPKQNQANP